MKVFVSAIIVPGDGELTLERRPWYAQRRCAMGALRFAMPWRMGRHLPRKDIDSVPKLKSHRGAYKRFTLSGTGKLQQPKAWKNHLRRHRSGRAKRLLHDQVLTKSGNAKQIKHLLPYGTR